MKTTIILLYFISFLYISTFSQVSRDSIQHYPNIVGGDGKQFVIFLKNLKKMIFKNQRTKIATQMFYPLHVAYGEKTKTIKTKEQFLKLYDTLFSKRMKKMILDQNPDSVFSNYEGIALQGGMVWIDQRLSSGGALVTKIITINNSNEIWEGYYRRLKIQSTKSE